MSGQPKKPESKPAPRTGKTDGSLQGAAFKPLKRPVNSDGFLIDRPLSPEEEGLAGPLPEGDEAGDNKSGG